MSSKKICLASDNWAGAHPAVVQAIVDANENYAPPYGGDIWTEKAHHLFQEAFLLPLAQKAPADRKCSDHLGALSMIKSQNTRVQEIRTNICNVEIASAWGAPPKGLRPLWTPITGASPSSYRCMAKR